MPDSQEFDFDFDVQRSGSDPGDANGERKPSDDAPGSKADERKGNGRKAEDSSEPSRGLPEPEVLEERAPQDEEGNGGGNGKRSFAGITAPKLGRKKGRKPSPPDEADPLEPLAPAVAEEEEPAEPQGPESLDDFLDRAERPKTGNGGERRAGGLSMPDLGEVGERIKNFRLPDLVSGRDGEPPFGGRIRIPGLFGGPEGPKRGKLKKGRLLIIFGGLALLAMVSTVFGMMMAVAGDLPNLENRTEFNASENSVVYDFQGKKIGTLMPNNKRILVGSDDIAPSMKEAAVAIEDQRFYEHRGVDFQGIIRAVVADVLPGGSTQGASTITQQFVKNALEAQGSRTVFQKLREAALAYHLERQWDKDKILTEYLNTIYFGEGAYGVEAAARTYFGANHPGCGEDGQPRCASELLPEESALLAGMIASPSAFSPRGNPNDSLARRNLVLKKMEEQGYLTETDYTEASTKPIPTSALIQDPSEDSVEPYFTSWLRQVLVDRYGAGRAFGGGLRVKTTLDLDLQEAVANTLYGTLSGIQPTGAAVVIDNKTGGIRALVGGHDYANHPFNLATQGHRQPGSAFKPFTLITALENGHSPSETYASSPHTFTVPNSGGQETFELHNYNDIYYGALDLATATMKSDNNVFMQLGYNIVNHPGWKDSRNAQASFDKIEQTAKKMGIVTDITGGKKANPAMVLGGLIQGVTPLEMTQAFETIANNGERTSGSLAASKGGPVPVLEVKDQNGKTLPDGTNKLKQQRVIPESVATTTKSILTGVLTSGGTGRRAAIGGYAFGKTGTTEDNGDAWFCGATEAITACVWVGHALTNTPMRTEFGGEPVDGGTFPALIWNGIIRDYENVVAAHKAGVTDASGGGGGAGVVPSSSGSSSGGGGGRAPAPAPVGGGGGGGGGVGAGL